MMNNEIEMLVRIENVSKKFCSNLKKSLWYGVKDIYKELVLLNGASVGLRSGEFWALKDLSFELKAGESIALLGPNGSGKSTLLRLINGLIRPDCGQIRIRGRVGALIELGTGFNPILTGRENIYVNAAVLGLSRKEIDKRLDEIIEFAEIDDFIDAPLQAYSSGMKVRLGFAVAANLHPEILLIDEVLAVGDVGFRMKCFRHLLRLLDKGTSIVVVSHNVHELSRVTDRAIVLGKGRKIFDGSLSVGIGHYQNLMKIHQQIERTNSCGEPHIESVRLLDEQGNEQREFTTGETVCAEIILLSDNPVPGARLIASIESPQVGLLGSFSTPYDDFKFDIEPTKTIICLRLPEIPLLIGSYNLNLNLYGPEVTDFYDRRVSAATFRIIGPPTNAFGFGVNHIFKFKHKWEKTEK